ncbi:hypothetical protein EMCRGX_G032489 [Ephydatia muelleri]|eukprot:Em0019g213a
MDRMTMDDDDEAPSARRPGIFNIDDSNMASQDILLSEYKRSTKGEQPSGPVTDAVPITLDEDVETIGEAFLEGDGNVATKEKLATLPRHKLQPQKPQQDVDQGATEQGRRTSVSVEKDYNQLQATLAMREKELVKAKRELEAAKSDRWMPPSIDETIDRLLIGQSCCLEWFKSLEEKEVLLNAATQTGDGNCIIAVLIYLRRTVNLDVLFRLFTKAPEQQIVMSHYCVHLKQLKAWNDVQIIYSMLGNYKTCASFQLKRIESIASVQEQRRELQMLCSTSKVLGSDLVYLEEYMKLLDRQLKVQELDQNVISESKKLPFQPLYTTLLYLCQWHGQEKEDRVTSPVRLKTEFNVSDKVLFQMRLMAECKRRDWGKFEQLLTSKGFFGTKLKSVIGFERVVRILGMYGAPQEVIHPYLMEIEDHEVRLDLATHYKYHGTAIETLKLMRDRQGMEDYINFIEVREQEKYRDKIQTLLANTQIKWK